MFSYHPDQGAIGRASCYAKGWQSYDDDKSLTGALLGWATSPSIYQQGYRSKGTFLCADWIGLDFDSGPSLREMEQTFQGQVHIIGTTKSHQAQKGSEPPCDRFRIWLKLSHTITRLEDYEATVREHVYRYDADKACVDGARLFWPCREITSVCWEGETADIVVAEERTYAKTSEHYTGRIPYWVREWLDGKCPPGTRNLHVFKTGLWLTKNGWEEEAIVSLVMESRPLLMVGHLIPMSKHDVVKAVKSGRMRALAEMNKSK